MQVVNYSELRNNMKAVMDLCCTEHELMIITRQKEPAVVMMSLEDYNALEETLYLMRHPANHAMLLESIAQAKRGHAKQRQLLDDADV